jgi:hypothetical protein
MEKAPTSPGVGASIKGGEQENELERTYLIFDWRNLCKSLLMEEEESHIP